VIQFVREWPPGSGGVERVAHQLASQFWLRQHSSDVIALARPSSMNLLPVQYKRISLLSWQVGKVLIPIDVPSLFNVLFKKDDLLFHLPCPTLFAIAVLARVIRPKRAIFFYWHAFLESELAWINRLISCYERAVLLFAQKARSIIVTTSPVLAQSLIARGALREDIRILPCALSLEQEEIAAKASRTEAQLIHLSSDGLPLKIVFVGRLTEYKRIDWIIDFIQNGLNATLDVIGWGPLAHRLIKQAGSTVTNAQVKFHGVLPEKEKLALVADSDILVLPFSTKHEAFGIVQLEAMVCGVPSITLDIDDSGAAWVAGTAKFFDFPINSKRQLCDALEIIEYRRDLLIQLRQHAKSRYQDEFSCPNWQGKFEFVLP
jgi:glycosyltransferase involved in cell wall biosynthesis